MQNRSKKILIIISISVAILFLMFAGGIVLITSTAVPLPSMKDVWEKENRIVLLEAFAQDSTMKYAEYCYDSGIMGYTAVQKAYVRMNDEYPIRGNVGIQSGSTEFNSTRKEDAIIIKGCEGDFFDSLVIVHEKNEKTGGEIDR